MKRGFTLPEVLLTLIILGVVTGLTVPVLFFHYKQRTTALELRKFNSDMSYAINMYLRNNQLDSINARDINGNFIVEAMTEAFVTDKLLPYLKTSSIDCLKDGNDCKDKNKVVLKNGACFGYEQSGSEVHFAFATTVKKCTDPARQVTINTVNKNKVVLPSQNNVNGRDVFMFTLNRENGFVPGRNTDVDISRSTALSRCRSNARACARLIEIDGWRINKKDYPRKIQ